MKEGQKSTVNTILRSRNTCLRILIISSLVLSVATSVVGQEKLQSAVIEDNAANPVHRVKDFSPSHSPMEDSVELIQEKFPRVLRSFWREFPNASNTKWYVGKNCVYVYYAVDGHKAVSVIRHGGFIEYSARYLKNAELPEQYAQMIATNYAGFSVINVREITVNAETSFILVLENEAGFVELAASFPEFRELKKVSKS